MGKKVIIAAGGTGGHLFPAQTLADHLLEQGYTVCFAGANLSTNRYFHRELYPFFDVPSATPFRRNVKAALKAVVCLLRGFRTACSLLKREAPALIVGFGSFHSFSVLLAARVLRIPYVLFESNALPGKVNRLFAKRAVFIAVYFPTAAEHLRGQVVEVEMPVRCKKKEVATAEALKYFGLEEALFTVVVFGGSQGAQSLNTLFADTVSALTARPFQVVHLAGTPEAADVLRAHYAKLGIRACVKAFEHKMEMSYAAASVVVARAGAATVAELIAFAQPAILIPYPHAADDHQEKNAAFLSQEIGGAVHFREGEKAQDHLSFTLQRFLDPHLTHHPVMQQALQQYQLSQQKGDLCSLICQHLQPK